MHSVEVKDENRPILADRRHERLHEHRPERCRSRARVPSPLYNRIPLLIGLSMMVIMITIPSLFFILRHESTNITVYPLLVCQLCFHFILLLLLLFVNLLIGILFRVLKYLEIGLLLNALFLVLIGYLSGTGS